MIGEGTYRMKFTILTRNLLCLFAIAACVFCTTAFGQNAEITGFILDADSKQPISEASIFLENQNVYLQSDKKGKYEIEKLDQGIYYLNFFADGYENSRLEILVQKDEQLSKDIFLSTLEVDIKEIEVRSEQDENFSSRQLRNVEGTAIYASKKSEVIDLENITANLATNNSRQIYKDVAGLNIWESDGAGLQLSIGSRGLDPNRTSSFNTRQNGYDISADALGYPESYYTPPGLALKKIEIVRGAASLQYGPQFGGLLNFILKKGNPAKPFEFVSVNSIGSWGLLNSFNSIGGQYKNFNYYAFYQRKQGNGFRPNSEFHQNTAFANLSLQYSEKLNVSFEYTHMDYLAQQAGGLVDFEFNQNPRQSKRERNWFQVNWNLFSLNLDYKISDKTKINNKTFMLHAQRDALGVLSRINRPDSGLERDLIKGKYQNFGNETRLIHRYKIKEKYSTLLLGFRYYNGYSQSMQGDANNESGPDFYFLNELEPEKSSYEFPSQNISFFAENLFNITDNWNITPGFRFEYIKTASMGYYKSRVFSGGELIFDQKFEQEKEQKRAFPLLGIGSSFKVNPSLEVYSNFSQNYKSINFSDLAISNPNLIVDSLLMDEKGFNFDLGFRGKALKNRIRFDFSLFYLSYKNRIGIGDLEGVAFRTNIGNARIIGLESFIESALISPKKQDKISLNHFINFSLLNGKYLSGLSFFEGNNVELIPPINIKTGFNFKYKNLKVSYQFSFVDEQYSDATNAELVPHATVGLIPSYHVQDLSLDYTIKKFKFGAGINNLWNNYYFTRRANAYPGPGIIPADGRNFYFNFGVIF